MTNMKLTQRQLRTLINEVLTEAPRKTKKKAAKKAVKKAVKKTVGQKLGAFGSGKVAKKAPGDKTFGQVSQGIGLRQIAKRVREHAFEHMNLAIAKWRDDPEMITMHVSDYTDALKVAEALEAGNLRAAKDLAYNMDTAARDDLAPEFWDLNKHADTDGFNSFD